MGIYGDLMNLNKSKSPEPTIAQKSGVEQRVKQKKPKSDLNGITVSRHHDTKQPRYHDTIQLIRAAVKQFGKEAATHRFTLDEKKAVAEVVYAYRKAGIRTSENEISRVGVNFLIEDYKANGENSILDKVLKALNQ